MPFRSRLAGRSRPRTLATADEPYTLALNGGGTITNAVQFLNTGAVTFVGMTSFTGGVDTINGASHPANTVLNGTVRTANQTDHLGCATLGGASTLNAGTATVSLTSTLAAGANGLTITAEHGDLWRRRQFHHGHGRHCPSAGRRRHVDRHCRGGGHACSLRRPISRHCKTASRASPSGVPRARPPRRSRR